MQKTVWGRKKKEACTKNKEKKEKPNASYEKLIFISTFFLIFICAATFVVLSRSQVTVAVSDFNTPREGFWDLYSRFAARLFGYT